jgi:hypothetical protein
MDACLALLYTLRYTATRAERAAERPDADRLLRGRVAVAMGHVTSASPKCSKCADAHAARREGEEGGPIPPPGAPVGAARGRAARPR